MSPQSIAIIIGIILIISLIFLVWYCVKGHNIMVGFAIMAFVWTVIALIGNKIIPATDELYANTKFSGKTGLEAILYGIKITFQDGPQSYGSSILTNIFFGAFFGRILIETGIASTIIKKTVELSGDKPRLTMSLLSIITAVLFVNMTGIGPVMAIAVIILPILLTIGIPAPVALFSYMGSIMAGMLANPINFAQYFGIVKGAVESANESVGQSFIDSVNAFSYGSYSGFGWIALAIALVGVIITSNIALGFKKKSYSWAADVSDDTATKKDAPWYSWFSILLPVLLITIFNVLKRKGDNGETLDYTAFSTIMAFIISSIYALITTGHMKGGYKKVSSNITKFFADGALDAAPMIGFLLTLSMFSASAGLVVPYLKAVVGNIIPTSALGLAATFGLLSFASFFRGPTNLVGSGVAFATIVFLNLNPTQANALGIMYLYSLFSITTIVPQHVDITQSYVAWGFGYTNVKPNSFMKMAIPTGYIVSIVLCFLAFFMYGM